MDFINFFETFLWIFEYFLFRAPRNQQLRKRLCPPELKLCLVPVEQRSTTSSLMLASKKNHPQPLPRPKNPQLKRVQPNRYINLFFQNLINFWLQLFFWGQLICNKSKRPQKIDKKQVLTEGNKWIMRLPAAVCSLKIFTFSN